MDDHSRLRPLYEMLLKSVGDECGRHQDQLSDQIKRDLAESLKAAWLDGTRCEIWDDSPTDVSGYRLRAQAG